jgi:A/G-specific adenine glycosylase
MPPQVAAAQPGPGAPPPAAVAAPLLRWYEAQGRTLPWRGIGDPYRIWVSEVMLQQTRVDTVLRYYDRFLQRFPDVAALAAASADEVLAAWAGLGFYGRAHNLHRAAREVVAVHGGKIPKDPDTLRTLPGIGRYTVGAILSAAWNLRLPILDGNVERVLSRVFHVDGEPDRAPVKALLWRLAEEVLPEDRPGDMNQALMDLGATLCVPFGPRCGACPLAAICAARAAGRADELPRAGRKATLRFEQRVALLALRDDGRFALRRRAADGLLASLWELPSVDLPENKGQSEPLGDAAAAASAAAALARQLYGRGLPRPAGRVEHRFSHRHWSIDVFCVGVDGWTAAESPAGAAAAAEQRWVAVSELGELGLPTVSRKAIELGMAAAISPTGPFAAR